MAQGEAYVGAKGGEVRGLSREGALEAVEGSVLEVEGFHALPASHPRKRHALHEQLLGEEKDHEHGDERDDAHSHEHVELGEALAAEQVQAEREGIQFLGAEVD